MKKTIYQVSVPKPCHENWEQMTPVEKGRFCQACGKNVIDFSRMTDMELIGVLQESKVTCGRFNNYQINTQLGGENSNKSAIPLLKTASLALLALLSTRLPAIGIAGNTASKQESVPCKKKVASIFQESKGPDKDPGKMAIHGTVTDTVTSYALVYVQIKLYKNDSCIARTMTDEDGKFSFEIPRDTGIRLECNCLGYDNISLPIRSADKPIHIYMVASHNVSMGIMIVTSKPIKHDIGYKIRRLFRKIWQQK